MEFMRAVVANYPQIYSCFRISNNGGDRSDLKENDTVQKFDVRSGAVTDKNMRPEFTQTGRFK